MKKIRFNFGFLSILFIVTLIASANKYTFISLLCAAIHEIGHLVASSILSMKLCEFNFGFLGARLKTEEKLYSYKKEILLCLFGPLFNFISAFICVIFFDIYTESTAFFITASLFLGVLNLLPIKSFDGGRIFECVLLYFLSAKTCESILRISSFICIFSLWCASVYLLLIYNYSLTLFVFSLSLFATIFVQDKY